MMAIFGKIKKTNFKFPLKSVKAKKEVFRESVIFLKFRAE